MKQKAQALSGGQIFLTFNRQVMDATRSQVERLARVALVCCRRDTDGATVQLHPLLLEALLIIHPGFVW